MSDEVTLCRCCGIRPGTPRIDQPTQAFSLAGAQMKSSVKRTIGCDECWAEFTRARDELRRRSR
mgnify:CR=1 FL=1